MWVSFQGLYFWLFQIDGAVVSLDPRANTSIYDIWVRHTGEVDIIIVVSNG